MLIERKRVWKQVCALCWDTIEAATALMGGHNPHRPIAVKPSNSNRSWKWYRVTIGDVKAEHDGHTLSFTSFPIEAYQSKVAHGRAYADFTRPLMTRTQRQRVDTSLG